MGSALVMAGAIACAVRIGLSALFLRAAISHGRDFRGFADIVGAYRIVPGGLSLPAAAGLVGAESAAGLMLVASVRFAGMAAAASGVAVLLLGVFAGAMAVNLRRGRRILCGCGDDSAPLSWAGFALTAGLVPLAMLCAVPSAAPGAAILVQAALAGIFLLVLHDATRLLLQPRARRAG